MTRTVHNCMDKALSVVGLGDIIIRHVKVNDQRKADCDDLKKHIQQDIQVNNQITILVFVCHRYMINSPHSNAGSLRLNLLGGHLDK